MKQIKVSNPILSGFYPDPSIVRVGQDYYMVNSTFSYFPGVPLSHSTDLIHWEQITNILSTKKQLNLANSPHSGGIYAPTIRYHKGTFYMITTNVSHGGNFIVTATNPLGPWSEPYFLNGAEGIDPSLFFDEDGTCYYCGTKGRREGSAFFGDNEIYVQEVDLTTMQLTGESYAIWHGALKGVEWPEGPHIYKRDGWYYLMIAEGGTGLNHAITMARSKNIKETFEGCKRNPIFTHRHLGKQYWAINTGHADIVETEHGDWYMVLLASRPCDGYCLLGRETFLVPLIWEDGWPIVNPGVGLLDRIVTIQVKDSSTLVEANEAQVGEKELDSLLKDYHPTCRDIKENFRQKDLPPYFFYLRNPQEDHYETGRETGLRLYASDVSLTADASPTALFLRQTSINYTLGTKLESTLTNENSEAGILLMQSNHFHYRFCIYKSNVPMVVLISCIEGKEQFLIKRELSKFPSYLQVREEDLNLSFFYSFDGTEYQTVAASIDASILSTERAGGFVGTCLGLYTYTPTKEFGEDFVDFDYLHYQVM
ncbi:glycoside hydrolase family 43 protein [Lachnoclostridium phytofermentans]|uniref:Alpha-N-arabinofuranosidase n=1 Tax=Lachnoclostridium phytofermentans (strain ATCC 700394 / DSM 18823 / ISDg) TaxID=357809 RepID=A9KQ56_LACP7|nr:glycoside hydrolase family 43 protein [Lachnoclostridium phytofermentans]ABX43368.1 Alpha-N-arabinofuranosidase [Lachnoclostridium phytofermentans ISDg]